jgi:hypothetical protein
LTPFECKYQIVSVTFLSFIDANEDLVMADDVVTPLNRSVVLVKYKEFEETPLDVNVFQRSCEEEPSIRMVRT